MSICFNLTPIKHLLWDYMELRDFLCKPTALLWDVRLAQHLLRNVLPAQTLKERHHKVAWIVHPLSSLIVNTGVELVLTLVWAALAVRLDV